MAVERVRVVVAEDHAGMRREIVAELQRHAEDAVEVVAEAGNGEEAFLVAMALRPDVVLMDVHMPVCSGLAAAKALRAAASQSKVVLMSLDFIATQEVLAVGACGFVPKTRLAGSLVRVVLECARGACPPMPEGAPCGARRETDVI